MRSESTSQPIPDAPKNTRIAIVRSFYYNELTEEVERVAIDTLQKASCSDVITIVVPGAFEVPLMCKKIIEEKKVDGVIALGLIIDGETHHAEEVARACTDGIMNVQLQTGIPIAHGVLYTKTKAQAEERCTGEKCVGEELACAILGALKK